jgi:hypothetical protein
MFCLICAYQVPIPYCTTITTTLLLHCPSMLTFCHHTTTIFPLPILQGLSLQFSAFLSPFLTAPFTSNLDAPSGLPQWDVSVALPLPPSLLPDVLNLQASSSSHYFCTIPSTSNLGVPLWLPQGRCSWFLFPPGGTRGPSIFYPGFYEGKVLPRWRHRFVCMLYTVLFTLQLTRSEIIEVLLLGP